MTQQLEGVKAWQQNLQVYLNLRDTQSGLDEYKQVRQNSAIRSSKLVSKKGYQQTARKPCVSGPFAWVLSPSKKARGCCRSRRLASATLGLCRAIKQFPDRVVLRFRLLERVPRHNLYRQLAELLDWEFLYQQTQGLYRHTDQPSLDPVVFFKLVLVGRLENLVSDRRLVEHCALRLDILYFLGYEINEDLPWHSTISRTHQLYPAAVFEHLFDQVFAHCLAAGLVVGQTHAIDSAPVKANAPLDSLRPKQQLPALRVVDDTQTLAPVPAAATTPAHELRRVATRHAKQRRGDGGLGAHYAKVQLLSNKTHTSGSDPEARISVKPGKAPALNYLCSLAVDTATGLINSSCGVGGGHKKVCSA